MFLEERIEPGHRSCIAHYLRHTEECCLKRCGARCHKCRMGIMKNVVCLPENDACSLLQIWSVELLVDSRSTRNHRLVFRKILHCLQHKRQIEFNLLLTAACEKRDYRLVGDIVGFQELLARHCIVADK